MSIQNFREQRATLAKEIRRMADTLTGEKKDFDASERANWDKLNKDYDTVKATVETMERASAIESEMAESAKRFGSRPGDEAFEKAQKRAEIDPEKLERAKSVALRAWALRGKGHNLSDSEMEACKLVGVNPHSDAFDFRLFQNPHAEIRAQSVGTTTAGGFLVPQGFVYNLEVALKAFNVMRDVSTILRTDTGNALPYPTVNDTTVTGRLLTENTAVTNTDVTFGATTFNAYKYSSDLLLISQELMTDSAFDLSSQLGELLGIRLGRIQGTHFTTGTGSSQPAGVVVGSTLGKTAASATAITADELLDLVTSVDPAYRANPGVGFMAHDNIITAIRKLKDNNNQYLWQPSMAVGIQPGQPDKLYGYPVYRNQFMQSSIATGTKTVLFGDFKKYVIRDVSGIRLVRMDERYADVDQVGFVAFVRSDAKVLNAGTNPIKHLIQL